MKRIWGWLLLAAVLVPAAQAQVYTWVDGSGVRHYSDTPGSHAAKKANLPGLQNADGDPDALARLQAESQADAAPPAVADSRETVITQPSQGQTLRDAQGRLPVAVSVGGGNTLHNGEKLTYYVDGQPVPGSPTDKTRLTLGNVPRGTHQLSVALLYRGHEIKRTAPLTFYMKPPTAISPLNKAQGGSSGNASDVPGASVAPPAGNVAGSLAAPRVHTRSATAGAPPS